MRCSRELWQVSIESQPSGFMPKRISAQTEESSNREMHCSELHGAFVWPPFSACIRHWCGIELSLLSAGSLSDMPIYHQADLSVPLFGFRSFPNVDHDQI